jgi:hypothetical protein
VGGWVGGCLRTSKRIGPSKRCAPRRFLSRTLRPDCLAASWSTKTREGSARRVGVAFGVVQVSLPVVGRLRFVGLHRFPPAVSPFPVAAPGCTGPAHAQAFPFEHPPPAFASRSARPTRSGTTRSSSPARTRATNTTRSCLPRTRSFRVPFSGTCSGPLPESPKALHRAVVATPRHRVPPSWFLTTSAGFSAPQGPGLLHPGTRHGVRCVSRSPSGRCTRHLRRAAGRIPPRKEGADRILAATTLRRFSPRRQLRRVTAADAFLPLFSSPPRPESCEGAHPEHVSPRTPGRSTSRRCSADESVAPAPVSGSRRTFLPWVLIPPRPSSDLVGVRGLPRIRSLLASTVSRSRTRDGESVRDGRRNRFRLPASRGM